MNVCTTGQAMCRVSCADMGKYIDVLARRESLRDPEAFHLKVAIGHPLHLTLPSPHPPPTSPHTLICSSLDISILIPTPTSTYSR